MEKIRLMHYTNQFFAGLAGEEKADMSVGLLDGPVGPGKRLQVNLGNSAEIVVTAYCGDNHFAEHTDEALASILQIARDYDVQAVVAGPAFASGRFGLACAEVCETLSRALGLNCVTGMHPENPGVRTYQEYMNEKVFAFPTTEGVSGMDDALSKMAECVVKLTQGCAIESPFVEGYIPRGFRRDAVSSERGVARAVDMLLDKMADRPFGTEIPVESLEAIPVASPVANLAGACVALATTSGVLPEGNPDAFKAAGNNQWKKYSIDKLNTMGNTHWDVMHGGYNTAFMKDNPNFGVPLDVCRELATEGRFGKLYPDFYMMSGCSGAIPVMQRMGRDMAANMKAEGVDAALLVST